MMKNVVKLLSLLAFCTQLSYADDLMDGLSAYERNDFGTAAEFFQKSCDNDNAEACYNLANMYDSGLGIYKDDQKAVMLFTKACDGGFIDSCYNLGMMYDSGEGVTKDVVKAFTLFYKTCEKDIPEAVIMLL